MLLAISVTQLLRVLLALLEPSPVLLDKLLAFSVVLGATLLFKDHLRVLRVTLGSTQIFKELQHAFPVVLVRMPLVTPLSSATAVDRERILLPSMQLHVINAFLEKHSQRAIALHVWIVQLDPACPLLGSRSVICAILACSPTALAALLAPRSGCPFNCFLSHLTYSSD